MHIEVIVTSHNSVGDYLFVGFGVFTNYYLFYSSFISDYQTWKLTKDGKLVNKAVNANWKFGKSTWEIQQGGYIMSKATKRVLDSEGRAFENGVRIWFKTGKLNQKWEAIPDHYGNMGCQVF